MLASSFMRDRRGSAARWFAYAAAAITITAVAGAHGLAWIAHSGRLPIIAFVPMNDRVARQHLEGVDMNVTGSIEAGNKPVTNP